MQKSNKSRIIKLMKKLSFIISILLLTAVFTTPLSVSAAENVGIKPGSFLYGFVTTFEKVNLFFTFNQEKKAEKAMKYAEKRLAEAEAVAGDKNSDAVKTAISGYEASIALAAEASKKVKDEAKAENLLNLIADNASKHQEILADVLAKVPDEAKEVIAQAIEASKKGQEEALKQIAELKGEVEQLKKEVAELKKKSIMTTPKPEAKIPITTPTSNVDQPKQAVPAQAEDSALKIARCQAEAKNQKDIFIQDGYKKAEDKFLPAIAEAESKLREAKLEQINRMGQVPDSLIGASPDLQNAAINISVNAVQPTIDHYQAVKQNWLRLLQETKDEIRNRFSEQAYNQAYISCLAK